MPGIPSRIWNICNQGVASQSAAAYSTSNAHTRTGFDTGPGAAIAFAFSGALA
jgi:hypothetical protein